jgi:hypothetical protein
MGTEPFLKKKLKITEVSGTSLIYNISFQRQLSWAKGVQYHSVTNTKTITEILTELKLETKQRWIYPPNPNARILGMRRDQPSSAGPISLRGT